MPGANNNRRLGCNLRISKQARSFTARLDIHSFWTFRWILALCLFLIALFRGSMANPNQPDRTAEGKPTLTRQPQFGPGRRFQALGSFRLRSRASWTLNRQHSADKRTEPSSQKKRPNKQAKPIKKKKKKTNQQTGGQTNLSLPLSIDLAFALDVALAGARFMNSRRQDPTQPDQLAK